MRASCPFSTFPLRAAEPKLDPLLPYQAEKSNPVVYDVDYSIVVTAESTAWISIR